MDDLLIIDNQQTGHPIDLLQMLPIMKGHLGQQAYIGPLAYKLSGLLLRRVTIEWGEIFRQS